MTWNALATAATALAGLGLTWIVQSSALLALGLVAGRALRRSGPAVQSGIYRTTLAAVLACPLAAALLAGAGFDGFIFRLPSPAAGTATARVSLAAVPPRSTSTTGAIVSDLLPDEVAPPARSVSVFPAALSPTQIIPAQPRPPAGLSRTAAAVVSIALGLVVWLLGSTLLGIRLLVAQRRMGKLRASAIPAEPAAEDLCRDLAGRMKVGAPAVLRSPFLSSPCLDGLRRPAILLPEEVGENLCETFIHELAHLARRDGLWNLLRRSSAAALWPQPLLWWLSRRLEATAEEVCDDYVVQFGADRSGYAGYLVQLAGCALPPAAPAGVGMISLRSLLARRVVRILDTSRSLSTRAGTRAVATTMLVGLAATPLAGLLGVGGGASSAASDEPAPAAKTQDAAMPHTSATLSAPRRTVRGRVVGPDGRPVAGATVTAARFRKAGIGFNGWDDDRQEMDRASSDTGGRFALTFEDLDPTTPEDPQSPDRWQRIRIVGSAPGLGPAWVEVARLAEDGPLTLELVRDDVPITGRLVDLEGRPVSGASVRVYWLWRATSAEAIDGWLKTLTAAPPGGAPPRSHYFPLANERGLPRSEPALPKPVTTDAEGRFRIHGFGHNRLAILEISGPTVALRRVQVVTREMEPVKGRHLDEPGVEDNTYHGADCQLVVEPSRPIEGVVRDRDTKEPIPGAIVTAFQLAGSPRPTAGLISGTTDAQGRYRLEGLPKGNGHQLSIYPPLDRPYFITADLKVSAGPGLGPVPFDIELKRGIFITGRVTDGVTGRPARAAIHYYPLLANEHAKDFRNFKAGQTSASWTGNRYSTDAEGRFRVVGLPGPGIVAAKSYDRSYSLGVGAEALTLGPRRQASRLEGLPTYNQIRPRDFHALAEVDPPLGAGEFQCNLTLSPGPSLMVRLVEPNGAAIRGVRIAGQFAHDLGYGQPLQDVKARIVGLDPGQPRTVVFQHPDRKLGAVLEVPGDLPEGAEHTVVLQPCSAVRGRLVDEESKPVSGRVEIYLMKQGTGQFNHLDLAGGPVDSDGRFRVEGLPAGGRYHVAAQDPLAFDIPGKGEAFQPFELTQDLTVEPGQVVDLGTFDVKAARRVDAPAKADPRDKPADVPITGRIVDLEGRPVAGVSVKPGAVLIPKADGLTPWLDGVRKGEPPWVVGRHVDWNRNAPEAAMREASTDKDGRFRLEGIGAERVVDLTLQGGPIAATTIHVATRKMDPIPARGFSNQHGPGSLSIYGADLTFTAAPSRPIEGVIKDARKGQPLAGAEVRSYRFAGSDFVGTMTLRARTDAQGRFRLSGMPKGKGNRLIVVPDDDQPYLLQEVDVPDPPGMGLVSVEVDLPRGLRIEGTLTEQATGKPVAGAWLHYMPFLENTFAQAHPAFDKHGNSDNSAIQDRYLTRADGTFRLVGLPGRAIVGALVHGKAYLQGVGSEAISGLNKSGHFETYRSPINPGRLWPTVMKEINPPADAEVVRLDLQVTTGPSVRLKVVNVDGRPVTGSSTRGLKGRSSYERVDLTQSEGEVTNLMPGEERTVMLRHVTRKIGKVVRVRKGDDASGPVVATLEPLATMTGRVADVDGNPVAGATVRPDLLPSGDFALTLPQVATDEQGRFLVPDVPVGCDYALAIERARSIKQTRFAFLKKATVRPGESTDVGMVRFKEK